MAIDKRTFKGGMNKDIDERLIPDDQYINGVNIKNLHGADGTMGVITPLKGNIQKGTSYSFSSETPSGGSRILTVNSIVPIWNVGNKWDFTLNFNISESGGSGSYVTAPSLHTAIMFTTSTAAGVSSWDSVYNTTDPSASAQVRNRQTGAALIAEAVQKAINEDSTLASHISVTCSNNEVAIECLQPGFDVGAFYFDNYTSPHQSSFTGSTYTNQAVPNSAKIDMSYTVVDAITTTEFKCVGVAKDEVNAHIYWFAHQVVGLNKTDRILRYIENEDIIQTIYSERQTDAGAILGLDPSNFIHSVDIIGIGTNSAKFLAWTDGVNPPRKINIEKCKAGYDIVNSSVKQRFLDNGSATFTSTEFVDVEWEGLPNGLSNKLAFVGVDNHPITGIRPGDVIFVDQDPGFQYHEYNGYFKITHVSTDGTILVTNKPFIASSPTRPGSIYRIIKYNSNYNNYEYIIDPSVCWYPEAYSRSRKHVKEQYFNAHKRGPRDKAIYRYLDDPSKKKNDLFGFVWQFTYRYVYEDDEVSALAPISGIEIPDMMALNSAAGGSYNQEHHNKIKIEIPYLRDGWERLQANTPSTSAQADFVGGNNGIRLHLDAWNNNGQGSGGNRAIAKRLNGWPSNIKAIEVFARQSNDSPFMLIETRELYTSICGAKEYKEEGNPQYAFNSENVYGVDISYETETDEQSLVMDPVQTNFYPFSNLCVYFYNDGIYTVLDNRNADKLYDWLPHKAAAQSIIDNSSITYSNVTDGFDIPCEPRMSVSAYYRAEDDPLYNTAADTQNIPVTSQLDSYLAVQPYSSTSNNPNFGSPDGISNNNETLIGNNASGSPSASQFSLTYTAPGYAPGNALISWPGVNGDWDSWEGQGQRIRHIMPLDLSEVELNAQGYVPIGTVFSSSGNFRFTYRYGPLNEKKFRFGLGGRWSNVTATVTGPTTTLEDFGNLIASQFKQVPDYSETEFYNQDDAWNVENWKTCEVWHAGTFYAENGVGAYSGKTVYVYFRSKGESAHGTDGLVQPWLNQYAFTHTSQVTTMGKSNRSFKTGAFHDFGLIYGNDRNQTSFVIKTPETRVYIKFKTENRLEIESFQEVDDSVQNYGKNVKGAPLLQWQIAHQPPAWAEWFQWVYAGNTTVKDFLQFTAESVAKNTSDSADDKIYLNLNSFKGKEYSYKNIDNPVIDYVYGEGDRIRFISNHNGVIEKYIDVAIADAKVYQYQTEATDIDPALSNPIRTFVESVTSNVEHRKKLMDGYFISFKAPDAEGFKWTDVTESDEGGYKKLLFEIYTPKKETTDGPSYYYGFSKKYSIEADIITGERRHAGHHIEETYDGGINNTINTGAFGVGYSQIFNNQGDTTKPASGLFFWGDVYLKNRRSIVERTSANAATYDVNNCEGFFANDFIKSDSYNKGRKHIYNAFAKEEHRNTTIYYSGPYLPSSNVNGLSEFNIIDLPFKEYSIGYGDIIRTVEQDSNLIVFQENKVSKVLVQKSILLGATGDSNVAISDQVLSHATPYLGDYGPALAPESVVKHENRIYFVDPIRGVMCRLGRDGITVISKNGMQSYFLKFFRERKRFLHINQNSKNYFNHIGGIDPESNEYIYYGDGYSEGDQSWYTAGLNNAEQPVGFYEDLNKYVSFYTYKPEAIVTLGKNMYTFSNAEIYLHNQDETKANYNKFYGAANSSPSSLEIIFNGQPSMIKTYNNLSIEGTYPWTPNKIDTQELTATFRTSTGSIHAEGGAHYWLRKEGVYHMPIPTGLKTSATAKYYGDKIYNNYTALGEVGVISNSQLRAYSSLTLGPVVSDSLLNYPLALVNTANGTVATFTITAVENIVNSGNIVGHNFTVSGGNFTGFTSSDGLDPLYLLMMPSNNNIYMEGERMKGPFAKLSLDLQLTDITFDETDEKDTVELYAINADMEYSPLSYKNN